MIVFNINLVQVEIKFSYHTRGAVPDYVNSWNIVMFREILSNVLNSISVAHFTNID